jgi:hypothetical protein
MPDGRVRPNDAISGDERLKKHENHQSEAEQRDEHEREKLPIAEQRVVDDRLCADHSKEPSDPQHENEENRDEFPCLDGLPLDHGGDGTALSTLRHGRL